MDEPKKIRVCIVDDHQIIIDGIASLLHNNDTIEVVGSANSGKEAPLLIQQHHPDILLMDYFMPEQDGIVTSTQLVREFPDLKIIMLTVHDSVGLIQDALKSGVKGYVLKNINKNQLVEAIVKVAEGHRYFDPNVEEKIVEFFLHSNTSITPASQANPIPASSEWGLSKRELDVLPLIARGLSGNEIAKALFISPHTVESHRKSMMSKLNVNKTAELVKKAAELGLI